MKKTLLVLGLAILVTGCSNIKQELGVGRNSPDEFTVVKRAPLTLPPDYSLRPPADGSVPPASIAAASARSALMGDTEQPAVKGKSENALLGKMGAEAANPDIRSTLERENGFLALENKTVVEKLIFWDNAPVTDAKVPASVVNPKAEAERLDKNKQEGKAVNEGDVPVIEKKKGTIDKFF